MAKRKRELLFTVREKDFRFIAKRGSGSGGQKKNKTSSAIQCFHDPSGAMGEAEDMREQSQNRKLAFKRCVESIEFQVWAKLRAEVMMGKVEVQEADDNGKMITRKLRPEEIDNIE